MPTKLTKLILLALLFSQFAVANGPSWPDNFEASYVTPSKERIYGCFGNNDFFTISLDFINKTYTKIDRVCHLGDIREWGERGQIRVEDDQVIKTITEDGYPDMENDFKIKWSLIDAFDNGYLTFDVQTNSFDEYDQEGNLLVHW
jgi:hypothetical protein